MNAIYKLVDLDLTRKIKYSEIEHDYLNRMYNNCIFPYDDPDKEEIYEVGEILFELITGKMHHNGDEKKYLEKNCKIDVSHKLCLSIIKFLHRCLHVERKYRISCDDALIHEFLEKKDFNDPLDFNKLPNDLVSKNKKIFYLPIYRPFLGLNDYEMKEYESLDVEF
jgi:serine/threonine protein kinase